MIVGTDKEEFIVHQDLICHRSLFFRAACSNHTWTESQSKQVQLLAQNANTFRIYLQWAYHLIGNLADLCRRSLLKVSGHDVTSYDVIRMNTCLVLCHVWMLADFLNDVGCKNEVISNLVREHAADNFKYLWHPKLPRTIYGGTVRGSGLRKWLVDSTLPLIKPCDLDCEPDNIPQEMLSDMLKAFIARKDQTRYEVPKVSEAWKYHE